MKVTTSKMWRSGVALLLALCLVAGVLPYSAFAVESEETLHYVSLGASNTNGYGLDGYLPADVYEDPLAASKADMNVYGYVRAPKAAYPYQIAAELENWTGKAVELHQLAISSMRVEEVRYLLDDTMEPDDYMNWRFTGDEADKWFNVAEPGGVAVLREAYRDALTDADYVTVDLGWNNFGVFAFNQIKTVLADGHLWKDMDMSYYMEPSYEPIYQRIKASVLAELSANMAEADSALKDKLELMADVLVAATMGACYNYDIVMEKIYELNPDVTVAVINIQNLADDLVVTFEGTELKLGDLYGELIDLVNLYRASESPYADKCVYVDAGDVTTFLDELVAWNGDPTTLSGDTLDCFDMYDDNLYVRSIVEYMMVGQALSGLFDGVRTMAAGYGLEVFKNDSQYTYEFALTREVDELLSLNLAALDFNNPGGADEDVELYGAAVAEHLKNLRGETANAAAYDYVFTNLSEGIQAQIAGLNKEDLQSGKNFLENQIEQMETESLPDDQIAPYRTQLEQVNEGLLAIETIIPAAKAAFAANLEGVYNTYHNTLNYAYDVVATIFQAAAKNNELEVNADSLNGFNSVSGALMEGIANSFIGGAMAKFNYELYANGLSNAEVSDAPAPDVVAGNVLALMESDSAVAAIAILAVRYELGNSFFAHPNPKGHDEITAAVMNALRNGSDADDFVDSKVGMYMELLADTIKKYGPEAGKAVWERWNQMGYVEQIEKYIDELIDTVEIRYDYYANEAIPAIEAAIEALEGEKDVLVAELDELNAQLAAKKAELEAAIAAIEVSGVYTPVINIDPLGGNAQTEVADNECAVEGEGVIAELEAAIRDIEHAIAVVEALIADVDADLADMAKMAEQIADAVKELNKTYNSIVAAAKDLYDAFKAIEAVLTNDADQTIEAVTSAFEAACSTAAAALDALEVAMGYARELDADILAEVDKIVELAESMYNKFISEDSLEAYIDAIVNRIKPQLTENEMMAVGITAMILKELAPEVIAYAETELPAKVEELKAECEKEIEALIEEYKPEIEKAEKELEAKWEEIKPEIEAKYEELKAEAEAEYAAAVAALEAKQAELVAELIAAEAELKATMEEMKGDAADKIEAAVAPLKAQIARLEKDLATVTADLACAADHLENALKLAYEEAKIAVMALYNETMAKLNAAIEALKAQLKKDIEALKAEIEKQIKDAVNEAMAALLAEVKKTVEDLKNALVAMGIETVEELVDALVALFNELLYNATHADLVIDENFKYVAMGDGSVEGYAEALNAYLAAEAAKEGIDSIAFVNAAVAGNSVAAAAADLPADVADADLITLGFSQTDMLANAITAEELDWAALVGEEAVPYIEDALAKVEAEINALDLPNEEIKAMLCSIVEAYAYNVVEYAINLPQLVYAIREVNADAVIIVVGMYNPIDGVTALGNDLSAFAEYFDYLIEAADAYGIGLAMLSNAMDYVVAPEVAVEKAELNALDLGILVAGDASALYPSAEGDAYIAEKIAEALTLSFEVAGLWGDADGDGVVTPIDAMLVLQFYVGDITEADLNVNVCDVDGDGTVSPVDAMLILQLYVGDIVKFPVEG